MNIFDKTKLNRDYQAQPLKRGEYPEIEDIKYLFLECGLSREETANVCGCTSEKVKIVCRKNNIQKTKEQRAELRKRTNLEKYGVENISQLNSIKEKKELTCIKNYGVKNPAQSKEVYGRIKETCLERYGFESSNSTESKKKKIKETCLEKYGVDNVMRDVTVIERNEATKRKNGTFNTSKPESLIYELLQKRFKHVKHPYKNNNVYPFKCDFYIPELDLYIEYQGFEGHGTHPFDINCEEDVYKVQQWEQKSKELNKYGNLKEKYIEYINTWTVRDPIKRQWAKENNLNYLEFFNIENFMEWYNGLE